MDDESSLAATLASAPTDDSLAIDGKILKDARRLLALTPQARFVEETTRHRPTLGLPNDRRQLPWRGFGRPNRPDAVHRAGENPPCRDTIRAVPVRPGNGRRFR